MKVKSERAFGIRETERESERETGGKEIGKKNVPHARGILMYKYVRLYTKRIIINFRCTRK